MQLCKEIPISSITPFISNWLIRVRVTKKTDIKQWHNEKGEGKLFNCNFIDSFGSEIRCTFFKEEVDRYYAFIEENKVILI